MNAITEHNTEAGRVTDRLPLDEYASGLHAVHARLSLYQRHNSLDTDAWRVCERSYPDGGREYTVTWGSNGPLDSRRPAVRPVYDEPAPRDYRAEGDERAVRVIRRKVRANRHDHLVTLTWPGVGCHDYREAFDTVSRFMHEHKALVCGDAGYVIVPELHPSGHGYHFHISRSGRMPKDDLGELRAKWTGMVRRAGYAPSGGARWARINVKHIRSRSMGSYLGKYIAKNIGEGGREDRAHRYEVAEGMGGPNEARSSFPSIEQALLFGVPHPGFWTGWYDLRPRAPAIWIGVNID